MEFYRQYSLYYFVSISLYAFLLAFFPLHCQSIGFSAFEIALITIAATLAPMLGTPLALHLAYICIAPARLIFILATIAIVFYIPLLFTSSFWPCLIFWFFCLASKRGADSLVDAQAVRDSASGKILFERVRLWGSIGFLLSSLGMGIVVRNFGISPLLYFALFILGCLLILAKLLQPALGSKPSATHAHKASSAFTSTLIKEPAFAFLLVTMIFNSASHAAYYTYFSLYLDHLHWGGVDIAVCWNVGVLAEIAMFLAFRRFNSVFSLSSILRVSMLITVLRWLILYLTDNTLVLYSAQLLHGFSYGSCYLASMKLVHEILPDETRDRAIGWLTAFGLGFGSIFGRLLSGQIAQNFTGYGETPVLFLLASIIAIFGLIASTQVNTRGQESRLVSH